VVVVSMVVPAKLVQCGEESLFFVHGADGWLFRL
jgi:hypothetical protein